MAASTEATKSADPSLTRDLLYAAWYYLGGRRGLMILAGAVLVTGLALNWSWLVAVGIAPVLVALAPCAIMCGLGLCMNRMLGGSCSGQSVTPDGNPHTQASPTALDAESPGTPAASDQRTFALDDDRGTSGEERAAMPTSNQTIDERS